VNEKNGVSRIKSGKEPKKRKPSHKKKKVKNPAEFDGGFQPGRAAKRKGPIILGEKASDGMGQCLKRCTKGGQLYRSILRKGIGIRTK